MKSRLLVRRWTPPTMALLLSVGCADIHSTVQEPRCVELVETVRFGDADVMEDGLDQRTIHAGAGVLGDVRGLTTGPDGSLWVLDRSWQKVAVFHPDGTFQRVVFGGNGEGPGEFMIPQDLTSGDFGVSVLDYELRRLTFFDWSGELVSVVSIPESAPFRHVIQEDILWVVPHHPGGARTGPSVFQRQLDGDLIAEGPPPDRQDQPYGVGLGIAEAEDGGVLVSTARPGVWMEYSDGSWSRKGTPLFPDDPAPIEERVSEQVTRVTPSQYRATGIAVVGDSLVLQAITAFPEPVDMDNPPTRGSIIRTIAAFDRAGEHLNDFDLPDGTDPSRLHVDPATGRIFTVTSDPFPQVIGSEFAACPEAG